MNKTFLAVSYKDRNLAKQHHAKWDSTNKLWYADSNISDDDRNVLLQRFGEAYERDIPIKVKYSEKDVAKRRGCKFNREIKKWVIPRECNEKNRHFLLTRFAEVK